LELSSVFGLDGQELLAGYEKGKINTKKDGDQSMGKPSKNDLKEQYNNRVIIGGVYCVKCSGTDNLWLRATTDMQGSKNRFAFSVSTNSCPEMGMIEAWKQFGATAFSFEILEKIEKKEMQITREFSDDVNTLLELLIEKNDERKRVIKFNQNIL